MRNMLMVGCLFFSPAWAFAQAVSGFIQFQGDTVHLELSGRSTWEYDLKKIEDKGKTSIQLQVAALDSKTIDQLKSFKSDFVKSVDINTNGPDGQALVSFHLAGDQIESFDYLTDQPSRLIVDFYKSPITDNPVKLLPEKKQTAVKKSNKVSKKDDKSKTDRSPAATDTVTIASNGPLQAVQDDPVKAGIFDGGDPDYERFSVKDYEVKEEALIRAKDNYYMPFPMLQTQVEQWEKLKQSPTIYEIAPQNTDENKQARLLLTLFEKGRFAVFLKTQEWFKEKYPESPYGEMIDFMTADVYLKMWEDEGRNQDFESAQQNYLLAIKKYPKSALTERTSLKLGYLSLERGDAIAALRLFNEHIENKNFGSKDSLSKDLARMGVGLAYMKLNRWEDAQKEFGNLDKNSAHRDLRVEAAFRKGDVWFRAKDFDKAISEYQVALKKYPEAEKIYPNAFYNQAESLFWRKKYSDSLSVFRDFIKKFPNNDHAPFAMTRLGELLEIFGADKSRVVGAYLETYFRYGESPSAVIARLRLLSARMKGMKPKEVKNAVTEIMSLAKKIDLPNMEQFATVMVADGYSSRGELGKAIELLSKYYKENPTTVDVPLISNRIIANINDQLQGEVEKGHFIKALKTHAQYADNWLKNSARLDTRYNLGRAFEMGGVPVEAEKYYKDVLNRVYAIRGTAEAKEIQVKEGIPSEDELNLRLAAVYNRERKYNQAYEYLKNIKNPEKLSETDQIERVNVAVQLLESRGDNESAIRYLGELLRTWKGQPELVAEPYYKLAELQRKQGKSDEALQALRRVDELQQDSTKIPVALHAKTLEQMGDIYLEQNQDQKAAAAYAKLLEKYEEKRPLSSIRYKLGEIHFKRGEIQKATETWAEFKGEKSEFWKNLAQEKLKDSHWRDGYKKYIQRIPAMSEAEQSK